MVMPRLDEARAPAGGRRLALFDVHVIGGDDAFEMAIFIMHQRHRDIGIAQRVQRVHRVQHVGQHRRLTRQRRQIERPAFDQRLHHVAGLQHADDIVHAAGRAVQRIDFIAPRGHGAV